jgi:hypothetical protein
MTVIGTPLGGAMPFFQAVVPFTILKHRLAVISAKTK